MNILILSWRGPKHPHEGGAEIVTHEHAQYWVKKGHQVTLFTSAFENSLPEETIDGVHVIRQGQQAFGVQIAAFFWYLTRRNAQYDIVIDHFHGIPFFTPLYVRVPKVAFIHEIAKNVWLHNPWKGVFHYLPSIIGKCGEPFIFKLFYRNIPFLTVSNSSKQDIVKYGIPSSHITVIQNGVKTMSVSTSKNIRFTIIFLGAIAKDKGIEDAIYAFKLVSDRINGAQLWVVGKGLPEYVTELKRLTHSLGIHDKVMFFGFVPERKKFELLKKSHVLVNSSVHEGWGLVNIEANSQGVPVVGYSVSGTVDSVQDKKTGLLVPSGNKELLADNILTLATDKKLYDRLSKQAREWSQRYTWETSCEEGLKYIEQKVWKNKK